MLENSLKEVETISARALMRKCRKQRLASIQKSIGGEKYWNAGSKRDTKVLKKKRPFSDKRKVF